MVDIVHVIGPVAFSIGKKYGYAVRGHHLPYELPTAFVEIGG